MDQNIGVQLFKFFQYLLFLTVGVENQNGRLALQYILIGLNFQLFQGLLEVLFDF